MYLNRNNQQTESNIPPRAAARYWRATMTRDARADGTFGLAARAERLDTNPETLSRAFLQVTGLRPRDLAAAMRLARFKKMLREGKGIADALYETGYGSTSRVYE